ncbi:TonB-dependent receptor plug domain-containing protein [SAR86 cluster bacterium]|nr:TonB-dependent receptor plug domain-containing protein [SAR86 cluster bacterium]
MKKFIKYTVLGAALALLNTFAYAQTVEEVTVTAARKEQSVQDVAISVQAISSEDLTEQHIESADDLAETIPGFGYAQAIGSGVGLRIRGLIFETIGAAQTQPGVTAFNGHTVGNRTWGSMGFLDAERIEVLEGPQGTLYGRNSTTGVVNFISNTPGADQYLNLTAGQDGLGQFSFARDFDFEGGSLRFAGAKYDKDGVIYNSGTLNDIDSRDSFQARVTGEFEMDEQNTLTFVYERSNINDSRQNVGTSACKRSDFFGCDPTVTDITPYLNQPVNTRGSVSNTFNILTNVNASNADFFAATAASAVADIDVVNKDTDPLRIETQEMFQLTNVMELDDYTVTFRGTYTDSRYQMFDDNDHGNATGALNGTLMPTMVIPALRTLCKGTLTNVTTDQAFECTDANFHDEQYEVNIVSDLSGPHNFTAGAYVYQSSAHNPYTIQTTSYLLLNDFDQHPYAALFGGALNDYGGQNFYTSFVTQLAANGADIATAAGTSTAALVGLLSTTVATAIINGCSGSAANNSSCKKSMPAEAGGLINDQRTQRYGSALYGEYYFQATDNIKLTLGARYMDDRYTTQSMQGLSDGAYSSFGETAAVAACNSDNYELCYQAGSNITADKNEVATYLAGVQYDYDQGMVYLSAKTGNRPGGANPDTTKYGESKSTQYEIGTKNVLFGGAMRLNATYFTQEVEDAHWSVIRVSSAYTNLHSMTHEGFQVNMQAFVTPSTILSVSALATDSTFDTEDGALVASTEVGVLYKGSTTVDPHNPTQATSFTEIAVADLISGTPAQQGVYALVNGACGVSAVAAFCPFVTHYAVDENGNYFINPQGLVAGTINVPASIAAGAASDPTKMVPVQNVMKQIGGNKVPGSADLETNIVLTQLYQGMGGSGTINLSYRYTDSTEGDIWNNSRHRTPASEFFNFNATYEPDNADWYVNLWARNLMDKRQQTSRQRTSTLQGGNPFVTFSQGMRLGLDFGYNF